MENSQLFRITTDRRIIFKKPKILSQINIKEIQMRNDPGNYLHLGSKSFNIRQRYLTKRKVKKKDIKGQIDLLSDLINNYSSSSIKNLYLIQKLKDENDFLIEELNRNIKKNTLFNKTTKEIFNDLVIQYEKRGYRIPSLTLENNLFKKSPLLIETKKDVDEFYKNNSDVRGKYIVDMNNFPEKNWNFLKKLKKVVDSYGDKFTPSNQEWVKMQSVSKNFYSDKKALSEKKERVKISKEINILKKLIKKKEKDETKDYFSSGGNKNYLLYNNKILNKSKFFQINIRELIKKRLMNQNNLKRNNTRLKIQNTEKIQNSIFMKKMRKKILSKSINGFFKNNKPNKAEGKTLITSLREKPKNNRILSYTEQMYHKINKKKLNEILSIEDDIIQYLKKKKYVINNTDLDNFNKDFSQRIYDIKAKIKRHDLSTAFNRHLTDYGNKGYKKLEKIQDIEKTIEEMDKYLAKHIIYKYFEE